MAMKRLTVILLLIVAVAAASPAAAGSDANKPANPPSAWSRFWKGVAADWKNIGKDAKESGTAAGRAAKKEIKQLPTDFRKGFEKAKDDFKKATGSSKAPKAKD